MRHLRRAALLTAVILGLIGCSTVTKPGFPKQSLDETQQIKQLEETFNLAQMLREYDFRSENASARDRIVSARLVLIDLQYNVFVSSSAFEKQALDTATDILVLGLSLGATAVGGAGTKTVLAAIASGVTGSKLSVDKNFYYEKTVSALVAAMNAQRRTTLVPIIAGMNEPIERYRLAQALSDLDAYYHAGTFVGALQAIQADAGNKETVANALLNSLRTTRFSDDAAGRALQKFWMPNWKPGATDEATFAVNADNQKRLQDWLRANNLPNVRLQSFITGAEYADLRKKAIKDLNVPVE